MGLFIDIEELSERQSDMALGAIYKAIHDGHGDDDIWLPLDNPFVARLVELFTQRGLDRLEAFREELKAWSAGERHRAGMAPIARPDSVSERWTDGERALVRLYLEHLPPAAWTLADWMMMVDYLVQRYLPPSDMRTEAEWLATRASIMGRVQASLPEITAGQADKLLAAMPLTAQAAIDQFKPTLAQLVTMDYARERAAENVRRLTDDARHQIRGVIAGHVEARLLGEPAAAQSLDSKLFDQFSGLNRDWRRIAVTETTEAQNQGYVASVPRGTRVKRIERYKGACGWCRKIDGWVMTVVDAADPHRNGDTDIWPGKTNVGRSAAPRKRLGGLLIEREKDELWWPASGAQHPHCRGRWLPTMEHQAGQDPGFAEWVQSTVGKKRGPHLPSA